MKIEFTEDQMKSLFSESLLNALSADQQRAILSQAIQHLITGKSDSYGNKGLTPIQTAFNQAVEAHAHQSARKFLEENAEARKTIDDAIIEGFRRFAAGLSSGDIYEKIAERMGSAFKNSDRY